MSIIIRETSEFYKRIASTWVISIRNLAGLAITLLFFALFAFLGFFIFGPRGEIIGLSLALFTTIFIFLFGDKLFLVAISAKEVETRRVDVYERLENMACLNQLDEIRIYHSFDIPVNVLCVHPFWGTPCVIFSDKIINQGDITLLEDGLEIGLELIKRGSLKGSNFFTFVASLLISPKFLMDSMGLTWPGAIYSFLIQPVAFLKEYINDSAVESFDGSEDERVTHLSFYLEKFPFHETSLIGTLSNDFSIIKRSNNGFWNQLKGSTKRKPLRIKYSEAKE